MKILAIDYGKKWIGAAISDEEHKWAFPHKVLENDKNLFKNLIEIVKDEDVYKIVIGLPLNKKMQDTSQTEEVRKWAEELIKKVATPTPSGRGPDRSVGVDFENEIFTTKMARGGKDDHSRAAALILESYLARQPKL